MFRLNARRGVRRSGESAKKILLIRSARASFRYYMNYNWLILLAVWRYWKFRSFHSKLKIKSRLPIASITCTTVFRVSGDIRCSANVQIECTNWWAVRGGGGREMCRSRKCFCISGIYFFQFKLVTICRTFHIYFWGCSATAAKLWILLTSDLFGTLCLEKLFICHN